MRLPETITEEIQHLDAVIIQADDMLTAYPNDKILSLSIEQANSRKKSLLEELAASLAVYGRHSIRYYFEDIAGKIKLETIIEGLKSFKKVIDKTHEAVSGGKSSHVPIFFNTVFAGSYGVQLSTAFEEKLFDNLFNDTFSKTIQVIDRLVRADNEQIDAILQQEFGDNRLLIGQYSLFFKKIHQYNRPIHIAWNSPSHGVGAEASVSPIRASMLHKYLAQKEVNTGTEEHYGILKGLSLRKFWVEFVTGADAEIAIEAKFDEGLAEEVKDALDQWVLASFQVETKRNESTDQVSKTFELISLHKHS